MKLNLIRHEVGFKLTIVLGDGIDFHDTQEMLEMLWPVYDTLKNGGMKTHCQVSFISTFKLQ
jgi:hypothetical protein